jgi:hypothetical protein
MKKELTDKVRVSHVLDAIGEVEKYLDGDGSNATKTDCRRRNAKKKRN